MSILFCIIFMLNSTSQIPRRTGDMFTRRVFLIVLRVGFLVFTIFRKLRIRLAHSEETWLCVRRARRSVGRRPQHVCMVVELNNNATRGLDPRLAVCQCQVDVPIRSTMIQTGGVMAIMIAIRTHTYIYTHTNLHRQRFRSGNYTFFALCQSFSVHAKARRYGALYISGIA